MGISYHLDEFFYIQKKEVFSLNPSKKRQSSSQGIFVGFVHALDTAPRRYSDTVRKAFFPEAV